MRFRASPLVELKTLDELHASQRDAFRGLEDDPEFHGLLVARPPLSMNVKAVDRSTAELFRSLSTPAVVSTDDAIDLVLDGILEVERDGDFVCGADALSMFCAERPHGAPSTLSRDALLHAQDLETSDCSALADALYLYNRIPITQSWRARFPDRESVLAEIVAPSRAIVDRHWRESRRRRAWIGWTSHAESRFSRDAVTYKLYISPRPEQLRDAFAAVARVLADFPGSSFKLGDSFTSLLRPDKLIAYFPTREELLAASDALRRALSGFDAHGVPFTAAFDEAGLLSWSIDPPESDRPLPWLRHESWRIWLTQRLGGALAIAKLARDPHAPAPWQFAIERARRHGVDVDHWTPSATLWSAV